MAFTDRALPAIRPVNHVMDEDDIIVRVADAGDLTRYERLLTPWIDTEMGQVVPIRPEIVSGYRLTHVTRS